MEGIDSADPGDHPPPLHRRYTDEPSRYLCMQEMQRRPVSLPPVCISLSSYLLTDTSNTTHSHILNQLQNISTSFRILTYHYSLFDL